MAEPLCYTVEPLSLIRAPFTMCETSAEDGGMLE